MKVYKLKTIAAMLVALTFGFTAVVAQASSVKNSNEPDDYKAVQLTFVNNTGIVLETDNGMMGEYGFSPDDFKPTIKKAGSSSFLLTVVPDQTEDGRSQLVLGITDPANPDPMGADPRFYLHVNDHSMIPVSDNKCTEYEHQQSRFSCTSKAIVTSDQIYHVTVTINNAGLR